MKDTASLLSSRLVPVAVIERAQDAIPLADALLAGGLSVIEITMRTPAALESMAAIKRERPAMAVGAGTVLDAAVLPKLAGMGVEFVVAPGLNARVVEGCQKLGLPVFPGVLTPSEIEEARAMGLSILKFFPAEQGGGAKMVAALAGPYGHTGLKFIPTGGINAEKAAAYWKQKVVAAVGGSWFVEKGLVKEGRFDEITRLTREAVEFAKANPC